jgi:hypothetical protein
MIFTVSMTSGVDHDRVEGNKEMVQSRMSEMLLLTDEQVTALLSAALDGGHAEYQQEHVRAWINTVNWLPVSSTLVNLAVRSRRRSYRHYRDSCGRSMYRN